MGGGRSTWPLLPPARLTACPVPVVFSGPTDGLPHARCPFSSLVLHNITRSIFETIVEQAPFAIEDLMNEMGAEDLSEGNEQEPGELCEKPTRGEDRWASHLTCLPPLWHLPWTEPAALLLGPLVSALAPICP